MTLSGNICTSFVPIAPVFDAAGKMLKDGTHPDCIMMWSEKGKAPTSDITISYNRMSGKMQGITTFWHPILGRDKVYRVKAIGNIVDVTYWHGIMLDHTPGSEVRGNRVTSAAAARALNFPYSPIKTWLKANEAVACGNSVEDYPTGEGTSACSAAPSGAGDSTAG